MLNTQHIIEQVVYTKCSTWRVFITVLNEDSGDFFYLLPSLTFAYVHLQILWGIGHQTLTIPFPYMIFPLFFVSIVSKFHMLLRVPNQTTPSQFWNRICLYCLILTAFSHMSHLSHSAINTNIVIFIYRIPPYHPHPLDFYA